MKTISALRIFFAAALLSFMPSVSFATPEFAAQTGYMCGHCHIDAAGGGALTEGGQKFLNERQSKGAHTQLTPLQKVVRFLIGYIHLLTAVGWFGTILYVHILLKPAYASRGLPKGELVLGWASIIVLSVTGVLLSIARLQSWTALYTTRFGILLSLKVVLFLLMASTAAVVTFYIGPRLRKKDRCEGETEVCKTKKDLTPEELQRFDGKEERPAYVAYKGVVYEVTNSRLWQGGSHARKHLAGFDLTDVLKTAPHGEEKIMSMPVAGRLVEAAGKTSSPLPVRVFYKLAYINLVFVFTIIFIIALWRWS